MRAGKLNHRLVIQYPAAGSPQRTATGQKDTTWTTLCTVSGSLEMLSGRRLEAAQATWPEASGEARIRFRQEVDDKDRDRVPLRIVLNGRYYPIGKVLNVDQRGVELRLIVKEGAARG